MSEIRGIGMSKENADNFIKKMPSYDIKTICNNCKKRFGSLSTGVKKW